MNQQWNEISINIDYKIYDDFSSFLEELGFEGISINKEDNKDSGILKAYFLDNEFDIDKLTKQIEEQIGIYNKTNHTLPSIKINSVIEEDWSNDWKKNFTFFRVGKNLVFKHIWDNYDSLDNDIVINFDSGAFFGTTPHPSTNLCLEEIEIISEKFNNKEKYKILDLGVGSGILSLAFYKLGFRNITAVDIDETAIRTSKDNFEINDIDINLFLGDLDSCNDTYDIIAGNLLGEIIIELADKIYQKTNKNGLFIGAGININQENEVISTLEKIGFEIKNKVKEGEWVLINAIKS
ncbi:MAG: 50S ribosomal protein L11 methyltransferase [Candidatus Sericytochromatia bacterium]